MTENLKLQDPDRFPIFPQNKFYTDMSCNYSPMSPTSPASPTPRAYSYADSGTPTQHAAMTASAAVPIPIYNPNHGAVAGPGVGWNQPSSVGESPYPFSAPSNYHLHSTYFLDNSPLSGEEDYHSQANNMQVALEKRRRRRESHNAVERRRRENINDRIQQLFQLLPEEKREDPQASVNGTTGPNKGSILRMSVDYVKDLQKELHEAMSRVQALETQLSQLHPQMA